MRRPNSLTRILQAQELVESLEWLNTPIPLRLRTIIFTSNAPVSARLKALIVSFLFGPLGLRVPRGNIADPPAT